MTSILPNPVSQFLNSSGIPIAGGFLFTYVPATFTPKDTWQDQNKTTLNSNPIVLNQAGEVPLFYGEGQYRIILQDNLGNEIFDQLSQSTLSEDVISTVMLPVVGASTLATARSLMGITQAIQDGINTVNLLPGPTGPTGPQGPQGPKGDSGSAGSSIDVQVFSSSGTWTKPNFGSVTIIEIWGAGAAGSDLSFAGASGPGGYASIMVASSALTATVSITIGQGGIFVSGQAGASGSNTSFGSYAVMRGGATGYVTSGDSGDIPTNGPAGYLSTISGITPIMGAVDYGASRITDQFGNSYAGNAFAPTAGGYISFATPLPSAIGGTGGTYPGGNGGFPGGAGAVNGGNGGNGYIVVSTF